MEQFSVRDDLGGLVEVSLRDRADDEPLISITRRTTLEIDFTPPEPQVSVVSIEPLDTDT